MTRQIRTAVGFVAGIALAVAVGFSVGAAKARPEAADTPPKFTVVATDGTHLIVTDNQAQKVLFYAIDQGGKPGDDLKYRGSINLGDVGKPTITPSKAK
jgi:hypothetical protein